MVEFPLAYVERPPDEPTADAPAALVLHGYGADEEDLLPHADRLPDDLHVFGVRGPHEAGDGRYGWMDSRPDPFAPSVDLLAAFAELVPEVADVAHDRIGLFGFSQGAKAALASLVEHPDLFRWAVSLNGFLPRPYDDPDRLAGARDNSVSAFVGVGEDDTVISPEHGERTADLLTDAGIDVTFRTYPVGHRISAAEMTDVAAWVGPRR
ncbi:alpha/beta hydrolase [Halorussus sp. MSC15.2]|uniref:alpha/beta hydrolase n=1 Tax=Halorussus sp. MSC15.2 TaxID=2283638 RepID=UPI0013D22786|nr:dienelactone hydrolase family protein [Halorussus sp. MSC15.2]NEU57306.1 phospholipase [Halorussus sp. MSC15.2]